VKSLKTLTQEPKCPLPHAHIADHAAIMTGNLPRAEMETYGILSEIPQCISLFRRLLLRHFIVLVDICRFPGVADPNIPGSPSS
jgi:hypothetical protein